MAEIVLVFQLDLQLQDERGGDLSDFIKNGEWDLIGKCHLEWA